MDGPLGQSYHLASKELCLPIFYLETYSMLTHQQIPLLLAKSALSSRMYPTALIALFEFYWYENSSILYSKWKVDVYVAFLNKARALLTGHVRMCIHSVRSLMGSRQ